MTPIERAIDAYAESGWRGTDYVAAAREQLRILTELAEAVLDWMDHGGEYGTDGLEYMKRDRARHARDSYRDWRRQKGQKGEKVQ